MKKVVLVLVFAIASMSNFAFAVGSSQPLGNDDVVAANQLVNLINDSGNSHSIQVLLLNAKSQIFAALQQAHIYGAVDIQSGTLNEGGVPMSQSTTVILSVYKNGNKLGNLLVSRLVSDMRADVITAIFQSSQL